MLVRSIVACALFALVANSGVSRSNCRGAYGSQKQTVTKIADAVKAAATQYQAGDYEASGKSLSQAMDSIDAAMEGATPELYDAFAPAIRVSFVRKRCWNWRALACGLSRHQNARPKLHL